MLRRAPQRKRKRQELPEELFVLPPEIDYLIQGEWYAELAASRTGRVSGGMRRMAAYRPDSHPELCFQMRLLGATDRQLAVACDVDERMIGIWRSKYPQFGEAYRRGGEAADAKVAKAMYQRAIGYSHAEEKIFCSKDGDVTRVPTIKHYPPDVPAGSMWLTNRQRNTWRNRQSTELSGIDGEPLQPPQLIINPVYSAPNGGAAAAGNRVMTNGHDTPAGGAGGRSGGT